MRVAAGLSTKKASSFAITRNMQQTGGSLSVSSDREIISYNVEVSRDNLDTGLKYLEAAATEQVFKPWELVDNLYRVQNDIARVSQPVRAVELVHKAAFHGGLGNSIFCPKHQISKLSSETLQHFYSSNFTTNRCAVVGVGVDHQLLVGFAQSLNLESGAGQDSTQKYCGGGEARKDKATNSASVVIAGEAAGWKNMKEALAFYVLQYAAGVGASCKWGSNNGAFGKVIAGAGGNSVGVSTFSNAYIDTGLFGFVVAGDGQNVGKVRYFFDLKSVRVYLFNTKILPFVFLCL
jgi:ubiquinol-cytochrome c reductase core subunit 2